MNRARKAVESRYTDTCTVYEYQSVKDEVTKITSKEPVAVLENQPCKLSNESLESTNQANGVAQKAINVKLFISPDVHIKPGSKIVVKHNNVETEYQRSGEPGIFTNHQEIYLKLFERWA